MAVMPVSARRPVPSLLRSRTRVRGTAAWLVVAALVFQTWLAAPFAMRMEAHLQAPAGGDAGFVLCGTGGGKSDSGPQRQHSGDGGGSAARHDHQHCILCQGGVATAIFAAPTAAWLPDGAAAPVHPAGSAMAAAEGGAASYAPRAPPANDDA
jgi:hypothetical protein